MADINIVSTIEEKVHVKLSPVTASGKPATVDGIPVWTVTSGDAIVEPDADGLGAFIISADAPGTAEWKVEADADLGEGVRTITATGTYNYTDAQAQNLGLSAEPPIAK